MLQKPSRKSLFLVGVLTALTALVPVKAYADTYPYFNVTGGDVWAGGWYEADKNGAFSCTIDNNYQDPFFSDKNQGYSSTDQADYGGIFTYAKEDASHHYVSGASGDFGVYALGMIEGDDGQSIGFASAGAQNGAVRDYSTFANVSEPSGSWGGEFAGSTRQSHCIPDYYDRWSGSATSEPNTDTLNTIVSTNPKGGNYSVTAPASDKPYVVSTLNSPVSIGSSQKLTLFVKGPAYIGSNITYPSDGSLTFDTIPKFALVVMGSLYIDPSVTQLDGVYIAQPSQTSHPVIDDTGVIWTCHRNDTNLPSYSDESSSSCNQPLAVNGSLIAKRVEFLRTGGDVSNSTSAETISYTPAMIVNGPFFNPGGGSLDIESLVSLPPVF